MSGWTRVFAVAFFALSAGCHLLLPGSDPGGDARVLDAGLHDAAVTEDLSRSDAERDAGTSVSDGGFGIDGGLGFDGSAVTQPGCSAVATEMRYNLAVSGCEPNALVGPLPQAAAAGLCQGPDYTMCTVGDYRSLGGATSGFTLSNLWLAACFNHDTSVGPMVSWDTPCTAFNVTNTTINVSTASCPPSTPLVTPYPEDVGIVTAASCAHVQFDGSSRSGFMTHRQANDPNAMAIGALCCRRICGPNTVLARMHGSGRMAVCGSILPMGFEQCDAKDQCAVGFHMCTPQEYYGFGGAIFNPSIDAWLAGCAASGNSKHDPPLNIPCGTCSGGTTHSIVVDPCGAGSPVPRDGDYLGVTTATTVNRLGPNLGAPCAYWDLASTKASKSAVMCCED